MKKPNFEAKGMVAHFQEELDKAHEKRRKWAHEITNLLKKICEPCNGYDGVVALDTKAFDLASEELKRLSVEVEDYRIQLNDAKEMI